MSRGARTVNRHTERGTSSVAWQPPPLVLTGPCPSRFVAVTDCAISLAGAKLASGGAPLTSPATSQVEPGSAQPLDSQPPPPPSRTPFPKRVVERALDSAGIAINGPRPWDLQVLDNRFFTRVLCDGTLGFGESFMNGWWTTPALDQLICRLQKADTATRFRSFEVARSWLAGILFNRQTRTRGHDVAAQHYNLGNDLFEAMLDSTLQYTCAYWPGAADLEAAQQAKLRLIADKLYLGPGMRVLELGGGFGGLAAFLARECGCTVVSYNNAEQQVKLARERCAGLPVRIHCADYRDAALLTERFHRVVSVGLCEHVGHKNYRQFLTLMHHRLEPGGLCLLHTIGANGSYTYTDPWIDKYIFPNGIIPSVAQLGRAAEGLWVIEDWHNFGPDYDRTLMAWWANFERAWPHLRARYDERFRRMWQYYLLGCAGSFRARKLQLWQLVLSTGDIPSYTPVR